MEILDGPAIVTRPERHTADIRVVTPFRGMFAVRDDRWPIELAIRLADLAAC